MLGPWKLLRFLFHFILFGFLAWLVLGLLWLGLPFPSNESTSDDGTQYSTSVLRSGKSLTRVYYPLRAYGFNETGRDGIAFSYRIDFSNLALVFSESNVQIPLVSPGNTNTTLDYTSQKFTVGARAGDRDGANPPWFSMADAVLLFWEIDRTSLEVELLAEYKLQGNKTTLEVKRVLSSGARMKTPLLRLGIDGVDAATLRASVPPTGGIEESLGLSSSPSVTYPLRVGIIHVLAPTMVFVNDNLGGYIKAIWDCLLAIFDVIFYTFGILLSLVALPAVIISFYRCLNGPSLETVVTRIQDRLYRWNLDEKARILRIGAAKKAVDGFLDRLREDSSSFWLVRLCREGWHPERDRARREAQEAADLEKIEINSKLEVVSE